MKNKLLFFLLCISVICCSKKNDINNNDIPGDIPAWLKARIETFKRSPDRDMYQVSRFSVSGTVYYNISLLYQSCLPCDVYDVQGKQVPPGSFQAPVSSFEPVWPKR